MPDDFDPATKELLLSFLQNAIKKWKLDKPEMQFLFSYKKLLKEAWQLFISQEVVRLEKLAEQTVSQTLYYMCLSEDENIKDLGYDWVRSQIYTLFLAKTDYNSAATEDLAQQVMLTIINKIHQLKKPYSFRWWFMTIAQRELIAQQPKLKTLELPEDSCSSALETSSLHFEEEYQDKEFLAMLIKAIKNIKAGKRQEDYKKLLFHYFIVGQDYGELYPDVERTQLARWLDEAKQKLLEQPELIDYLKTHYPHLNTTPRRKRPKTN